MKAKDQSKPAEAQGLYQKFKVYRLDGSDAPGNKHHGCEYFVIDMHHDPHAKAALVAYAEDCKTTHPELSNDLLKFCGVKRKPFQHLRDWLKGKL